MTHCTVCSCSINERTDVRFDMDGRTFCSGECIFKYRGTRRMW